MNTDYNYDLSGYMLKGYDDQSEQNLNDFQKRIMIISNIL